MSPSPDGSAAMACFRDGEGMREENTKERQERQERSERTKGGDDEH